MNTGMSQPVRVLIALGVAVAVGCLWAGPDATPAGPSPASKPLDPMLFQRWPDRKPDVALILTGEQHSYLKFCGCSSPQFGGFERRYNFMAKLREKGWPLVALDLGDLVYKRNNSIQQQTLLKYKTQMQLLGVVGTAAIGLGANDFNLPLFEGLAEYTLQKPDANPKVLTANLLDRNNNFPDATGKGSMINGAILLDAEAGRPSVGVVAVVANSVREAVKDKSLKFDDYESWTASALKQLEERKAVIKVLLFQGMPPEAEAAAKKFPQFQIVLCKCPQEEPPSDPIVVGNTLIVQVGQRGRHLGVVGAFPTGDAARPNEFHYQRVALGEEYETDKDKEAGHPVLGPLTEYAKQVRDQNLLTRYLKEAHPTQIKRKGKKITFVGSDACKTCHVDEYAKWAGSKHSHAFEALTKYAVKPTMRQFDPECVGCHVIGFEFAGGYMDERRTPHLKHVGCENCHGPGSLHVEEPFNRDYRSDMSPWKSTPTDRLTKPDGKYDEAVLLRIDAMCAKCHDTENDPKYKFEVYWPKIEHGKKPAAPAK